MYRSPLEIGGWTAPGYERLREAFTASVASEDPGGAQLCVYHRGREVAALHRSSHGARTLGVSMSCTKGVVAILAQLLVAAGVLNLDAPVARVWPEFAAAGKDAVTLRHLLTHSAGLLGFEPGLGITVEDYSDWDFCTARLAAMEPLWATGTAYAYHFATWGFLIGEVIRRATGESVGAMLRRHVTGPLDAAYWIGLPEQEDLRVTSNEFPGEPPALAAVRERLRARGVDPETRLGAATAEMHALAARTATFLNTRAGRACEIPALNGVGSAAALAKIYAAAIGTVDGVRLLDVAALNRLRAVQTDGLGPPEALRVLANGPAQRLGLGVELPNAATPMLGDGSFGHAGIGGQLAFAHPESEISAAFLCSEMTWNGLEPDPRWRPWTQALAEIAAQ